MSRQQLTSEQVLTMLAAAPGRIALDTKGVVPQQLQTPPGPDEWSANEVLAHLRACADVWGGCIATILAQDRPTIRAVNPRTWIKRTDYLQLEFQASLDAYAAQRTELTSVLEGLQLDEWSREATVTGTGKPLERTVFSYAHRLALHERPHLKQIERAVNILSR